MSTATSVIKVLHVYRTYFPDSQGGAEEVIRQLCANRGSCIESRVFVPSAAPQPKPLKIDDTLVVQVALNFEIASCGFCFTGLNEYQRQIDWADVVHYHFPWPFADIMHGLAKHRRPSLVTYHSDIVRQQSMLKLYAPLMHRFLSKMDAVVATSPNYQRSSKVLQVYEDKVSVIPLGIEESAYPKVDSTVLQACQAQFGKNFFFFIGVLRYYKGLHILIEACRHTDIQVVIAGSGPLDKTLREQAQGLDNVKFAGQVTDAEKIALFTLCRGIVFASHVRSEAFGVTLLEGAMLGKPLVTAETGTGTSYVNIDGETGLVVAPDDAGALRDAMQTLIDDEALAKQFGLQARVRYEKMFTGKQMGAAYAELYRSLHQAGH